MVGSILMLQLFLQMRAEMPARQANMCCLQVSKGPIASLTDRTRLGGPGRRRRCWHGISLPRLLRQRCCRPRQIKRLGSRRRWRRHR